MKYTNALTPQKKKIVEQPLYKRNESNKLRVTNNRKRKDYDRRMMSPYSSVQTIIDNDYYSANDDAYEYLHIEDYIGEENI